MCVCVHFAFAGEKQEAGKRQVSNSPLVHNLYLSEVVQFIVHWHDLAITSVIDLSLVSTLCQPEVACTLVCHTGMDWPLPLLTKLSYLSISSRAPCLEAFIDSDY